MARRWRSEIWRGQVRHQRRGPRPHAFVYPLELLALDLDEVDDLFRQTPWYANDRPAWTRFVAADFLGRQRGGLPSRVRHIARQVDDRATGRVVLATVLRQAGRCFNPVSFYLVHDAGDKVRVWIAEITNTPWGERHRYVLPLADEQGEQGRWSFAKSFHISPFMSMSQTYHWSLRLDAHRVGIGMVNRESGATCFQAGFLARREVASPAALQRHLLRQPLASWQILGRIYWQALLLWWKGTPVHSHPDRAAPAVVPAGTMLMAEGGMR